MKNHPYLFCSECGPAIALYEAGKPLLLAAQAIGRSVPWTAKALRHHGVTIRPKGGISAKVDVNRITALYADGKTASEISREFGVSREYIRQLLLLRLGTTRGLVPRHPHRCNAACAIVIGLTEPLHLCTLSQQVGIPNSTLRRAAKIHGIESAHTRGSKHRCKEQCKRLLAVLTAGTAMSIHDAARQADVNPASVYQRFRAYHREWPWPALGGRKGIKVSAE